MNDADQCPNRPPKDEEEADLEVKKSKACDEVGEANPEGTNLELEVAEPNATSGAASSLRYGNEE